ncbi:DUF3263 domain-containing protein [Microcystis phage MinS1]|nr:DUF3263 domain-containing protein [Microcystis phage MinS1]
MVRDMTTTGRRLTVREHMALQLEQSWWRYPAAKETRMREELGWSAVRHYQVLNDLIGRPEALAAYPLVVRRLLRLRDQRRGARAGSSVTAPACALR